MVLDCQDRKTFWLAITKIENSWLEIIEVDRSSGWEILRSTVRKSDDWELLENLRVGNYRSALIILTYEL